MQWELFNNQGNPDYPIPFPLISQRSFNHREGLEAKTGGNSEGKPGGSGPSRHGNQAMAVSRAKTGNVRNAAKLAGPNAIR